MFNMLERLLCYNGYDVHMITHRCSWRARWSWKSWIFTIVNNSCFLVVSVRKYTKKYNYLAQYLFNDFFPHKMIIFADIRFRLPMFWTYIMSPSVLFSCQIKIAHLAWQG